MRLHVYAKSHVHYSRRNAQLLYLSISQGSIGVLVFFHHISGGVRVLGGGEGEGQGVCVCSPQPGTFIPCSLPSFTLVLSAALQDAVPRRRGGKNSRRNDIEI